MKKERTNKRNHVTLIALVTLMMFLLSACGSTAATETKEEAKAPTQNVAETKVEEPSVVEEVAEPTTEVETEVTTEAAPEPIVYEGIDMESTLPGEEWALTFEGIINKPVMVVFNDSTNKKVFVENGGEVDFALDDTFALYIPGTVKVVKHDLEAFNNMMSGPFTTFNNVSKRYESGDSVEVENILEVDGQEVTFTVTLHLQ